MDNHVFTQEPAFVLLYRLIQIESNDELVLKFAPYTNQVTCHKACVDKENEFTTIPHAIKLPLFFKCFTFNHILSSADVQVSKFIKVCATV